MLVNTNFMKNIVYGLVDSRNDLIYYVGKSSVGDVRALSHLTNSHSDKVNKWIKDVRDNWGDIKVILIEEIEELGFLAEREQYWISYYKTINDNLLNIKCVNKTLNELYTKEDEEKFSELKRSIIFCGDVIKKERMSLGITQEDLSKISDINRWTLSQIENNRDVSISSIKKCLLGLTKINMDKKKSINKHRVSL